METPKTIIISLGGSLVVPGDIDTAFVRSFRELIERYLDKGHTFYITVGGGKVARNYQFALKDAAPQATRDDADWIGIHSTRLNAHFLKIVFGDLAATHIITDPRVIPETDKKVVIGAGWEPGWSTDYVATELARTINAHVVINLSNIDHVYSADPKKDPEATPINDITWTEYRKLIPKDWDPGLNSPFDPIASKDAEELGLEVVVMGKKLEELEKYFKNETFAGTVIHP